MLIYFQILSTWYVLDIYSRWYKSKFYQLDMCWIFIHVDTTPNSINSICLGYLFPVIELQILSTVICLRDLSTWIELRDLSTWIELRDLSTWIELRDLSTWIELRDLSTLIYLQKSINVDTSLSIHANMSWIFINANRTPRSIKLIYLGYLFPRICFSFRFLEFNPYFSTWIDFEFETESLIEILLQRQYTDTSEINSIWSFEIKNFLSLMFISEVKFFWVKEGYRKISKRILNNGYYL